MSEAFILGGIRTPIGRHNGALAAVRPDDMAAHVIRELVARHPDIDFSRTDEVILGCTNQAGEDSRNVARVALLLSGLPLEVPGITVNRLCASGLEAVADAARRIKAGDATLAIAGGVESMSRAPIIVPKGENPETAKGYDSSLGWRFINPEFHRLYGTDSMPETAEILAEERNISRKDQDAFAYRSHMRVKSAKAKGFFESEIVPIPSAGRTVAEDEHPRPGTTLEVLATLKTPFRQSGTVTAGNASGINDGAAALFIASGEIMKSRKMKPLARVVAAAAAGVPPRIMGIGPVPAVKKILVKTGLKLAQMDVIEINEAFAAQVLACLRELKIPDDDPRVNPNGGAIALGHPLGMSGARLVLTAARELERRKGRYALVTMCVGVGQGAAMVLERV
ncbi:MAG TPA: acetyl-CoA C-acyltransferase [Sphingomonadales bacterium]|nr:acetyl-CoA C-acyltransferase [Sphingomonadales bacterium]